MVVEELPLFPSTTVNSTGSCLQAGEPDRPNLMSAKDVLSGDADNPSSLDVDRHVRALVRLIQCAICSHPIRQPVILPCGDSICRTCIPKSRPREHVSYPDDPARQQVIICPISTCTQVHSTSDCCGDVVLSKVLEAITTEVSRSKAMPNDTQPLVQVSEVVGKHENTNNDDLLQLEKDGDSYQPHSGSFRGGRLIAIYSLAERGGLRYSSEATCSPNSDEITAADAAFLEELKEAAQPHVECHVCYNVMLDPTTTPCGHTFCRGCLTRIAGLSSHCAVCRRELRLPTSLRQQPSNKRLVALLDMLCHDQVASRASAMAQEAAEAQERLETPLFVCGLSFPDTPTFLHIFEPRYRLMIRRAEQGNGLFGMLGYNTRGINQGALGRTHFFQYGTMLRIESIQYFPDGRSFILTRGVSRFRVLEHGTLDDYTVGRVETIEDVPLAEEERIEAEEIRRAVATVDASSPNGHPASDSPLSLDRLPTAELLRICVDFVERAQANSAPWLHRNILEVYGEPPTNDPAIFPYWFASVLPIQEDEKLKLLPTTSVRQRLKMTTHWIRRIEAQRWYHGSSCTLL